jgi:hypothetical protein
LVSTVLEKAMDERTTRKPERKQPMNADVNFGRARMARGAPGLDADIQAHIGQQLRAVYDEVAREPLPDRFLKLLEELEKKEAGKS